MNALITVLSRVPMPLLYGLAACLRVLAFNIIGYRRKVIDKNLRIMFPDAPESERKRIRRDFQRYFSEAAIETLKGFSMSEEELRQRVTVENPELLAPYIEKQQSMLILTLHQTNIEWLVGRICLALPCPVAGVYKPLHNEKMDRLVKAGRARFGKPVPMKQVAREVLRQRKSFRAMLLAADQSPISREKRFWHPFFGVPAPFYYGPQTIAEAGQSVVVFVHPRRISRGHYSIRWEILAEPPHENGGTDILERFIDACERSAREQPETWWLSNKKWKKPKPWEEEISQQA
ncbi:KDO2-lipid IV(A) lauroyltransferase [Litorivivens lipolytica]|uniref:KDO2-lipid IV(A) lauroyltransferase n=1 Tax=Litorivivens lipolytica TaxID=1524264 RepID=A0A7W4Z613_9GAMM|nr:lysophospholipid acyltransferase family protein [Litorivivens lipolytica]MBB3048064.1 KDO2-lipid IV(A) lauroyltransferase [Litorivivens lipolytica]